jgi:hypothetical protein
MAISILIVQACTTIQGAAILHDRPRHRQAHARGAAADERPAMIRRRAAAAGIETKLGNHSFRATRITAYLKNGSTLQRWRTMPQRARRSFTGAMRRASVRSSGL